MASSSSTTASSLPFSSSRRGKRYDVFISFRGEDTRTNFMSHLHGGLSRRNIETYVDDMLVRGDVISHALMKAIEDSYVSLVIFSENYASSKWCLDELTKIIECKELEKQVVIPIFYKIDPSHVRKQLGSYKKALKKHESDFKHDKNRVLKWKAALVEAANLAGYDSHNYRTDYELVEQIVKDVMQKLDYLYPCKMGDLIGAEQNCAVIESLLANNSTKVQIIGIWGMGGIGKTTLVTALFNKLSSQYEGRCFLEDVRIGSKTSYGLNSLRNKLLSKLLGEENHHICTFSIASSFALSRLSRRRVFIVLDDVDNIQQLEYLFGEHDFLGLGSRVIVTTRDKHVLSKGVDEIYEVQRLSFKHSLQLFSLNAFSKNSPERQFKEETTKAVMYAKGNPLALKVLGLFLHSKSKKEWQNALRKLQKIPNREIQNVLRLSYDELDDNDRNIFLDIACFFKGRNKDDVSRLLDACGFYPDIGIRNLVNKALVTISEEEIIEMHDLIQEMGWEVVRQESIKDPGCRSRLWDSNEVYHVLKNNRGTNAIEGIVLNASESRDLYMASDVFKKMVNLRFLIFNGNKRCINVYLPSGLKFLPDGLVYLFWSGYPLKSLPSTFFAEKLVEIHMRESHVEKLWDGIQNLPSLEVIELRYSKHLLELPDLSRASNLKTIILAGCTSLREVHPSILSSQTLEVLYLSNCKSLKSLKSSDPSSSLKVLDLWECSSLQEFSIISPEMKCLNLGHTALDELPSSILLLQKLEIFTFRPIESLCKLPTRFVKAFGLHGLWRHKDILTLNNTLEESLTDLEQLEFHSYPFSELPGNIIKLRSLCFLSMEGSQVVRLPANMKQLSHLKWLRLQKCKKLQCLPELPPSLHVLDASDCISLEIMVGSTCDSEPLKVHNEAIFRFENCIKLSQHALNTIYADAHSRITQAANHLFLGMEMEDRPDAHLSNKEGIKFSCSIPGDKIPYWFSYCSIEPSLTFQPPSLSKFYGFALCVIVGVAESDVWDVLFDLVCDCSFEADNGETINFKSRHSPAYQHTLLYSSLDQHTLQFDHMFLWYDTSSYYCQIMDAMKHSRENYIPKFSFTFSIETESQSEGMEMLPSEVLNEIKDVKKVLRIKSCAVHPIYASKDLIISEEASIKSNRSMEIHELESLPQINRQVIPQPFSSGSWKQKESKGLKEVLFF